jgi:hypothetical protein
MAAGAALDAYDDFIKFVHQRAKRNQRWAYFSVTMLSAATALIPILILTSTRYYPFLLGKLLPSLLAAVAAVGATWVTLRRPVAAWVLFRHIEELAKVEKVTYEHRVGHYARADTADEKFILRITELQLRLNAAWSALVPTETDVAALGKPHT